MTTTETSGPSGGAATPPASPQLQRPRSYAYRGVCTALARTTGTDVLLWRVLFIVLTFFNGLGILLYIAGLLLIPRRGQHQSIAERLLQGPDRRLRGGDVVLVGLLVLSLGMMLDDGNDVWAVAVLAGVALLFLRSHRDTAAGPQGEPVSSPPLVRPDVPAPMGPLPELPVVHVVTPASRQRSALGALTLGAALLLSGLLVLLDTTGAADIRPEAVMASALAVVGAGLVAGAWWGRSALLVVVALLLSLGLAASSVIRPMAEAGVGDRTWEPSGTADYRLGVGEATLDLRTVVLGDGPPPVITARVDIGELIVIVPPAVKVEVDMHADIGELRVPGIALGGVVLDRLHTQGIDLESNDLGGRDVDRELTIGPEGPARIVVDASVRFGQVTVIRRG